MAKIKQEDRDAIVLQSCKEREHALRYRQRREKKWRKTDDLYYGNKPPSLVSRANIHLPVLHGAIENLLSKIDGMPSTKIAPAETADAPKAQFMQKSLELDSKNNDWESNDTYSKKEAMMYGRSQEKKYAETVDGKFVDYRELVLCIDFLIDPLAGGLEPFKKARFCGQDNIIRTEYDLESSKLYDQDAVKRVIGTIRTDARVNSRNNEHTYRKQAQHLDQFAYVSDDAVNLTEWYTTYKGVRYYVLFSPLAKEAIRVETLKSMTESDEFPYSSWAAFADAEEYWSMAPAELFHDINYAQNVSVSQLLDNSAQRSYGMKAYDMAKITNPAFLDPKPGARVPVVGNPNDAIMDITFPSIGENLQLLNWLGNTVNANTGNTDSARGVPQSKRMSAAEFEGLIDQVADRVYTHNRMYLAHYRRLVLLYTYGVWEFMTEKRAMDVEGVMGANKVYKDGKSLKMTGDFTIEVTLEEAQAAQKLREERMAYVQRSRENPRLNQRFLDEIEAKELEFSDDELARLTTQLPDDTWRSVSEAELENEEMVSKNVVANEAATFAHIQRHLDAVRYVRGLKDAQRERILKHAQEEMAIAERNMQLTVSRALQMQNAQQMQTMQLQQPPQEQPAPMAPAAPQMMPAPTPMAPPLPVASPMPMMPPAPLPQASPMPMAAPMM